MRHEKGDADVVAGKQVTYRPFRGGKEMSTIQGFTEQSLQERKKEDREIEKVAEVRLQSENLALRVTSFVLAGAMGGILAAYNGQHWAVIIPFALFCGLAVLMAAIFISSINRQVTIAKLRDGTPTKDTND